MRVFGVAALAIAVMAGPLAAASAPPEMAAALQSIAERARGGPALVVAFRGPGEQWAFAAGPRRIRGDVGDRADATDPFRIASVTKSFTAAAILRLVEDGRFELDDPIGPLLPAGVSELLTAGGYRPDRITVRHLLAHGSGLRDYATTRRYMRATAADPLKPWTDREQVALAVAPGKPLFDPGARTAYSDTGYVLLGGILSSQTGKPLPEAVPALLGLADAGPNGIGWEVIPERGGSGLPPNAIRAAQGGMDTGDADPRFDYHGGGGMVASAPVLLDAFAAVVEGRVFRNPQTALTMQQVPGPPERDGTRQALGVEQLYYGEMTCFGHKGHWGTMAVWCPAVRSGFVFSVNAAGAGPYRRAGELHSLLAGYLVNNN